MSIFWIWNLYMMIRILLVNLILVHPIEMCVDITLPIKIKLKPWRISKELESFTWYR